MTVSERIAYIQQLFRKYHENPSFAPNEALHSDVLLPEYTSVPFEARSAQCAAQELQQGHFALSEWRTFFEAHAPYHRSQLLVGLGWALAECAAFSQITLFAHGADNWRIADGYGYFSGLFKRREAVRQQVVPKEIPVDLHGGYDQGLGRSLWYILQGDPARIAELIAHFPTERHASLWRGVGLAMAYVGGVDAALITQMEESARAHLVAVQCGAVLALDGRFKTGVQTQSDLLLKKTWFLPTKVNFSACSDFPEMLRHLEALLPSGKH